MSRSVTGPGKAVRDGVSNDGVASGTIRCFSRPMLESIPIYATMARRNVATRPDAGLPDTVASSELKLSAKMLSPAFDVGFDPREAVHATGVDSCVRRLRKCDLGHFRGGAVPDDFHMNMRGASLIPPGIDGGERHLSIRVGRLNAAQINLEVCVPYCE